MTIASKKFPIPVTTLFEGVTNNNRTLLAKAITLVESNSPQHYEQAQQLLNLCLPKQGYAYRIGVSGIPGGGKSSFIEAFGWLLAEQNLKVGVLAIDPSSSISKGSILGDKTRMEKLSRHNLAYIRPSPSSGLLGGVAKKTRETMLLFDAAGYDFILVETVGVGQSEIGIRAMVDCFMLLLISGAGDELQGFKKGINELADMILINKADGDNLPKAEAYCQETKRVMHFMSPVNQFWSTPVIAISSKTNYNLDQVFQSLQLFRRVSNENSEWKSRREKQKIDWFQTLVHDKIFEQIHQNPTFKQNFNSLLKQLQNDEITILQAVEALTIPFNQ